MERKIARRNTRFDERKSREAEGQMEKGVESIRNSNLGKFVRHSVVMEMPLASLK